MIKRNKKTNINQLFKISKEVNVAELIPQDPELDTIGQSVLDGYNIDLDSRDDFDRENREIMKLVNAHSEQKSFPFEGAADIKLPIITRAALQFAARAMPELIPSKHIVKMRTYGTNQNAQFIDERASRADRATNYMNFQLREEMSNWIDDTDHLLHTLPVLAGCIRKIYYDESKGHVDSEVLTYTDIVVNIGIKSLEAAPRITQKRYISRNEYMEYVNSGIWIDDDRIWEGFTPSSSLKTSSSTYSGSDPDNIHNEISLDTYDEDTGEGQNDYDLYEDSKETKQRLFLEQHGWLDLDGDGYEEPYIVTVHYETGCVVRIAARYNDNDIITQRTGDQQSLGKPSLKFIRIKPRHSFVKYSFIPNPNGNFYDIGFGRLLLHLNSVSNSLTNQIMDAGTAVNAGGGFTSRGVSFDGGEIRTSPGEWLPTNIPANELKTGFFPFPVHEPSQVLFHLLGLMTDMANDVSSVSEAMSGQKPGENVSAPTVMALIEQGLKVFTGIHKRIHRAMTKEFKMIYDLNYETLNEQTYFAVTDSDETNQGFVGKEDFNPETYDIIPSADPNISLDIQRMSKAEALMQMSGRPGVNEEALTKQFIKAMKVNPDEIMYSEQNPAPPQPPDPEIEIKKAQLDLDNSKIQLEAKKIDLEQAKLQLEAQRIDNEAMLQKSKATLDNAKTEEMVESTAKTYAETQKIIKETTLLGTEIPKAEPQPESQPSPKAKPKAKKK